MKKVWIFGFVLAFVFAACGGQSPAPSPVPDEPSTTVGVPPTETPIPTMTRVVSGVQITPPVEMPQPPVFDGQALPVERGDYFAASGVCSACHTQNVDGAGNDVSIEAFWRATMMANSARDPYWQASVRAETLAHPGLDAVIQDTCSKCHTPMARSTGMMAGIEGLVLDGGYLNPENELHSLGIDGTSCTLCHQIEADHLGEHESFDGGFVIDAVLPAGERLNHGPYEIENQYITIMQSTSGYIPQQGLHIQTAEMCASCHTLYTPIVDAAGEVIGLFPEQMPYLEWLASDYAGQQSCQDCHMPLASGEVVLSVTGGPGRSPFSRHSFVGGNTYALNLLRHFGAEIGVTASSAQIEAALQRAGAQLQGQTAQISIEELEITGATLMARVSLSHQVGHKFPSGFPSRRVWVHLTVFDSQGQVIFESGNWAADGAIVGNDNDLDAARYEPHYTIIESPEQVQIYEAIMGDAEGQVTTPLLSAFS